MPVGASQLIPVSGRQCPLVTGLLPSAGARGGTMRLNLSMRSLGGEVVVSRWGRSPVLRRLAGGVRGQRRCRTCVL